MAGHASDIMPATERAIPVFPRTTETTAPPMTRSRWPVRIQVPRRQRKTGRIADRDVRSCTERPVPIPKQHRRRGPGAVLAGDREIGASVLIQGRRPPGTWASWPNRNWAGGSRTSRPRSPGGSRSSPSAWFRHPARSGLPSPLKSAIATETGIVSRRHTCGRGRRKSGSRERGNRRS